LRGSGHGEAFNAEYVQQADFREGEFVFLVEDGEGFGVNGAAGAQEGGGDAEV
jgi:hypothetical protein